MKYSLISDNLGQGAYPVLVPTTYCCRQSQTLHPRSAKDILVDSFGEDFGLVLRNYLKQEPEQLRKAAVFRQAEDFSLESWEYQKTESVLGQPINSTVVDFMVSAVVHGTEKAYCCDMPKGVISRKANITFRIRYILDLRLCHSSCLGPMIFPEFTWTKDPVFSKYRFKTDEYLIPIIGKKDYETVARSMIDDYFPENRKQIGTFKVDAEELARRMNLTVKDVRFADSTVLGQIYYGSGTVTLINEAGENYIETVLPGMILINIATCVTAAIRNSTIIHECSHMYLDRWFFLLQMMAGRPYASYTSRTRTGIPKKCKTALDWMELQCDKLPAYILMESKNTKAFIEAQLSKEKHPYSIDATRRVVNAVANEYAVSGAMAKYRMIELGFHQAEGVFSYVDGVRIPDHGCSKEWKAGITYSINAAGAAQLMTESRKFALLATSGKYLYINGHFCLIDEKYLYRTSDGTVFMSYYAREHMEECCLSFTVSPGNRDGSYQFGLASRKKKVANDDKYQVTYSLDAEPGTELYVRENNAIVYGSSIWGNLLKNMPFDFKGAVLMILEEKGITQEALALELGVDRKVIYRLLNSDNVATGRVIGLCVALKLPYFISDKLLELSGNSLRNTEIDLLYRTFLLQSGKITVERCNDILKSRQMSPLFNGEM